MVKCICLTKSDKPCGQNAMKETVICTSHNGKTANIDYERAKDLVDDFDELSDERKASLIATLTGSNVATLPAIMAFLARNTGTDTDDDDEHNVPKPAPVPMHANVKNEPVAAMSTTVSAFASSSCLNIEDDEHNDIAEATAAKIALIEREKEKDALTRELQALKLAKRQLEEANSHLMYTATRSENTVSMTTNTTSTATSNVKRRMESLTFQNLRKEKNHNINKDLVKYALTSEKFIAQRAYWMDLAATSVGTSDVKYIRATPERINALYAIVQSEITPYMARMTSK